MQDASTAVDRLLRGQRADFTPLYDSPWSDTLEAWVKQGMPAGSDGKAVDPVDHFGFDMAGCGGWYRWTAKPGPDEILEETDAWKAVRNGNGAVLKWWKHRSGTPEHLAFHMTSREIWEKEYKPHLLGDPHERVGDLAATRSRLEKRRRQGKWTSFGSTIVWENLRASLGDENMFAAMAEDPEWVHDFNRTYTDLAKRCYAILFAEAGRPDGVWIYEDLGYRDRLFCSPAMLENLFFPYFREMVEFFHGYGLPVVLHSCGYQEPMIPLAIAAGFDGLNPMEVKAGNDLLRYAERWGEQLCFVGGLDARVLESGDRAGIRREVTRLVTGMRERGARYVFGSDHSISTGVRYEDFRYALDVYRDLRAN